VVALPEEKLKLQDLVSALLPRDWASILLQIQFNISLIKKNIKFSSNIRKFRMKQLQSHI
jgi:hypothetical protein